MPFTPGLIQTSPSPTRTWPGTGRSRPGLIQTSPRPTRTWSGTGSAPDQDWFRHHPVQPGPGQVQGAPDQDWFGTSPSPTRTIQWQSFKKRILSSLLYKLVYTHILLQANVTEYPQSFPNVNLVCNGEVPAEEHCLQRRGSCARILSATERFLWKNPVRNGEVVRFPPRILSATERFRARIQSAKEKFPNIKSCRHRKEYLTLRKLPAQKLLRIRAQEGVLVRRYLSVYIFYFRSVIYSLNS